MNSPPLSPENKPDRLLKILGVTFGIAVTVGGMIGLGILRTPGLVAAQLPDRSLILLVWIIGAAYALLGTLAAAELASSIRKTGGWYAFVRRSMGEYPAFLIGWMDWLAFPIGLAATAITVGEYSATVAPWSAGNERIIAVTITIGLGGLNWIGLRSGSRVQEVTSFVKAAVFLLVVAACFVVGGDPSYETGSLQPTPLQLGLVATVGAIVIALQGVIYTYDGWHNAAYFAEENKDPGRSLPRAMISGVLSVAVIYLLVNLALLYVLDIPRLAASALPAADAAEVVFGVHGKSVVTALAIISLLSIINSSVMIAPRILFALSRDGLFIAKGSAVNAGGTPSFALGATIAATVFLILIGSFETLLAMSAFMFVIGYLAGFISLIILRRNEPELSRPFRMPFYPYSAIVLLISSVAFLVGVVLNDTVNAAYVLVLMVATYPLYLILKRLRPIA
jgi:APA family basic amino acid/polyamine antiporter